MNRAQKQPSSTTPSNTPVPSDALSHWLGRIRQTTLPMLPHTGKKLRRALTNDQISLNSLLPILAKDPIASLMVMRRANTITHSTPEEKQGGSPKQITTIEHGISILGFTRLRKLMLSAPTLEASPQQTSYVNYVGSLMRSLHAAFQARDWAALRGHHQPEQVFLSALMYGAPIWALWQTATAEMKIIEHLKLNENIPAAEAERAVLGIETSTLSAALAQAWQLPPAVRSAYDPDKKPDLKTFLRAGKLARQGQMGTLPNYDRQGCPTNTTATQVQLANWFAQAADISWHSRQMARCAAVIAAFLNQPLQETQKRLQAQALNLSRHYCLPGVQTPGSRLLQTPTPHTRRKLSPPQVKALVTSLMENKSALAADSTATAPAALGLKILVSSVEKENKNAASKPLEKAKIKPDLKDAQLFKKLVERLRHQTQTFADHTSVLQLTGYGIASGIGLERVLIFEPEKNNSQLKLTHSYGKDGEALQSLTLSLSPPNLFTKLMQKPAALRVDQSTNRHVMTHIPATFKEITKTAGNFFITSLFEDKTPITVLYVDQGNEGDPMRESQYQYFKAICKAAAFCLNNL